MKQLLKTKFWLLIGMFAFVNVNAQKFKITNLEVSSGKNYQVKYNGFNNDSLQYIDRPYLFDRIPEKLQGTTLIMTAGNDKMFEENELCFSFDVNKKVLVHVIYADKFPVKPVWLKDFTKTNMKVYRDDSSQELMKGIFSVYTKEYPAGNIRIMGCLGKGIKTEEFVRTQGYTFCMYSVVVEEI